MSKKRMMTKAQRIYYEQSRKEKIMKELIEYARYMKELEEFRERVYRFRDH